MSKKLFPSFENIPFEGALDFVKPFDGQVQEISAAELINIAPRFESLVADLMLNNIQQASPFGFSVSKDGPKLVNQDVLQLERADDTTDTHYWGITVKTNNPPYNIGKFTPAEYPSHSITLSKRTKDMDKSENWRVSFTADKIIYGLMLDGIVRRHDSIESKSHTGGLIAPPEVLSADQVVAKWRAESATTLENWRLEANLGFNDQQIDLDELQGLEKFVSSAVKKYKRNFF